jgi:hypothetical protein
MFEAEFRPKLKTRFTADDGRARAVLSAGLQLLH